MLFPSPSGSFLDIVNGEKYEEYCSIRSIKDEVELIEKTYNESAEPMKVDSVVDDMKVDGGWRGIKPCETNLLKPYKTRKIIKLKKGETLKGGFKQFLSNKGNTKHLVRVKKGCYGEEHVDFDSLCGKHLLICCFSVPMLTRSEVADECRAIIETYDYFSQDGHPFEMVVVVKMRSDAAYDQKTAFYHFYSAFSCLAIPFSDFETRDYISSCFSTIDVGLNHAILVDPKGLILSAQWTLDDFLHHGPEWAPPFVRTTVAEIERQDHVLRCRLDPMYALQCNVVNERNDHLSLYGDILLCSPHLTLRRFDPDESSDVASTVLDLTRKYVGLYLCFDGGIMEQIKAAHDYCLANNQQLEIVLVCMSLFEEPNFYYQHLFQTLRLRNIKSWFLFDYDSKVCRRLCRAFGQGFLYPGEKFIIIPPNCESGELYGREFLTNYGTRCYPSTRSAVLKQRLEFLRSLTPLYSSLFKTGLSQNGEEFNSEQLRGKNLLLYLDSKESDPDLFYDLLMEHYPKMKLMGWEIVFVPATYKEICWNRQMVAREHHSFRQGLNIEEMPWIVMSPSASAQLSVRKHLTFPEEDNVSRLVAVRKDGNIVSRQVADQLFQTHGVTESLLDDVLEIELALDLALITRIDEPIRY